MICAVARIFGKPGSLFLLQGCIRWSSTTFGTILRVKKYGAPPIRLRHTNFGRLIQLQPLRLSWPFKMLRCFVCRVKSLNRLIYMSFDSCILHKRQSPRVQPAAINSTLITWEHNIWKGISKFSWNWKDGTIFTPVYSILILQDRKRSLYKQKRFRTQWTEAKRRYWNYPPNRSDALRAQSQVPTCRNQLSCVC